VAYKKELIEELGKMTPEELKKPIMFSLTGLAKSGEQVRVTSEDLLNKLVGNPQIHDERKEKLLDTIAKKIR
jgi:hypothetical protein